MAAFRLQLFVVVEFEETIAGEKLQVSIKGFSQPKKKKKWISKLFKDKKASPGVLPVHKCMYIHSKWSF